MVLPSSTLVNVAEDAELRLVRWLADAVNSSSSDVPHKQTGPSFLPDCEACISNADVEGLLRTILEDEGAMQALFVLEEEKQAVSALSLLAALVERTAERGPELAAALADAIVNVKQHDNNDDGAATTVRRLTLLSTLYNLRLEGREKCAILTRMIRLASEQQPSLLAHGQPLGNMLLEDTSSSSSSSQAMLEPPAPALADMVDGWDVPVEEKRALFQAVAEGIPDSVTRKQRFMLLWTETYADAAQVDATGLAAAKEAAIGAMRDPVTLFVQQRSMLTMPAIQALATTQNGTAILLHGLLTIFQEGKLQDYQAFLEQHGGQATVLAPFGLKHDECLRYMRILSLCSLAAEQEEIPYAAVVQTLKLPSVDEVESWVIAAVSSGLLAAKMDQLQQKVMVERSVVRRFDMEQWKALQLRLNAWKQNVRGVLEGFKQQQQQQSSSQVVGTTNST